MRVMQTQLVEFWFALHNEEQHGCVIGLIEYES
jgi:hypothetical protein